MARRHGRDHRSQPAPRSIRTRPAANRDWCWTGRGYTSGKVDNRQPLRIGEARLNIPSSSKWRCGASFILALLSEWSNYHAANFWKTSPIGFSQYHSRVWTHCSLWPRTGLSKPKLGPRGNIDRRYSRLHNQFSTDTSTIIAKCSRSIPNPTRGDGVRLRPVQLQCRHPDAALRVRGRNHLHMHRFGSALPGSRWASVCHLTRRGLPSWSSFPCSTGQFAHGMAILRRSDFQSGKADCQALTSKSASFLFPPFNSATSQRGFKPRPAQV